MTLWGGYSDPRTASGGGTTNFAYLAGNKTRITDPLNYQTTNTANGFGNPDDGNLIKTEKAEGVTVDFGYDIYGNQTRIAAQRRWLAAHQHV